MGGTIYRAGNGNMRNFGPTNPHGTALHQSNSYIKRNIRVWRAQKCIALFGAQTVLTSAGPQTTAFHGGSIGPRMEIIEISGLPIPMVPRLHHCNGYMQSKLWVWRAKKCIALVGAETVLTSAGPQTTRFQRGQDRAGNGNMRNIGPTKPHDTAFALKQWLH